MSKGVRQKPKREPLLIDRLLASDNWKAPFSAAHGQRLADTMYLAKRFVLDESATKYLGEMVRKMPRVIADAQDFAIPPFERMWIEIPFRLYYETVTGAPSDVEGDQVVGYLFDGPVVSVAAYSRAVDGGRTPGIGPIQYMLNRPLTAEQELRLTQKLGISRAYLDVFYWGESFKHLRASAQGKLEASPTSVSDEDMKFLQGNIWGAESEIASLRALRATHSFRLAELPKRFAGKEAEVFDWASNGSAGDLRNIIALLLFLNRTQDIQYVREQGFAPAMIDRKPRQLLPHRVISFKLDPMPRLQRLCAGHGVLRRLHDVRGHFCHNHVARHSGCQHPDWEEFKPLHWRCPACNGVRWWRKEHHRGKLDKGVVESEYAVSR